ncbi:MFS transporter [Bartonella taylorii]|uniref:MFS transporter n=1 Tax=Bartonella taylorii TaxID=33046 RepID=A0A9Q8YZ00_BARTA|nr:MFS transporter [Bartonella taylorii]USP03497.1 MFS transporter [Bartonella taylorii]
MRRELTFRFYGLVVVLYLSDMVLFLSNLWNVYRITSSSVFLGVSMALGTLTPYLLKKSGLVRIKSSLRLVDLYKRRIIIYSLLILIALFHYADSPFGFIAVSISIGYLSLITLSTLETYNTKLALKGYISAQKASRIMQTVVQIGAFLGAALSGYLLEATSLRGVAAGVGYNGLIAALCVFDIIVSLVAGYVIFRDEYSATGVASSATEKKLTPMPQADRLSLELKLLCVCIGLIGFHICAYNTLATILFQSVKNFSSEYYGLCSAVAGVGAFLAAFIKIPRFEFILPALMLGVADLIFSTTQSPYLAVVFCFFIGFSMNTMRINARKHMIEATQTETQAELVGSYSGMLYTISQSAGYVILGLLTSPALMGPQAAIYLLPLIGVIIFIYVLFLLVRRAKV